MENKLHIQPKYFNILNEMEIRISAEKDEGIFYYSNVPDIDGENLHIGFGRLPRIESFFHLNDILLDYIALASFVKKREGAEDSISLICERYAHCEEWFGDNPPILSYTEGNHFVSVNSDAFIGIWFNAHYEEFASLITRTYNSFVQLLREEKGIESPEEKEKTLDEFDNLDEYESYAMKRNARSQIQTCTLDDLLIERPIFRSRYIEMLLEWSGRKFLDEGIDIMSGYGHVSDEEIHDEQEESERKLNLRNERIEKLEEVLLERV